MRICTTYLREDLNGSTFRPGRSANVTDECCAECLHDMPKKEGLHPFVESVEVLGRVRVVRFLLKFPLDCRQIEEAIFKLAENRL